MNVHDRFLTPLDAALEHAARGWHVFPVPPGTKKSHVKGENGNGARWGATTDPSLIRHYWRRWPEANVGIACGPESGLFVVEADTEVGHGKDGIGNLAELIEAHGALPATIEALSPTGSWHIYFGWPQGVDATGLRNSESVVAEGVDVRGGGGMVVAVPSVKPGVEQPYRWKNPPPLFELAEPPAWLLDRCMKKQERKSETNGFRFDPGNNADADAVLDLLRTRPNTLSRTDWVRVCNAIKHHFGESARGAWLDFSNRYTGEVVPGEAERVWNTSRPNGSVGLGTVVHLLGGFERTRAKDAPRTNGQDTGAQAPFGSEDAIALEFVRRHGEEMRYVALWAHWLLWDGRRWARDDTLKAFDAARAICREAAARSNKANDRIATAKTVAAIATLARSDRRIAATVDQWDANPWLLNTPGGVVDLRTGGIRPARPTDYMTKSTAVAPGGDCPIWRSFLARITGGDADLEAYLQRLVGYGLTGLTREHVLAFAYGKGANGKGCFIGAIAGAMGHYHTTAPIETFTATTGDRHPTDLAMLRGARLVTAQETEEGRRWAESKIKTLTGGDRVSARFMRQDFFEFTPQFTLLIAGNHKPGLRAVDEAIRRRFHLIPFDQTIPPEERDLELPEKLKAEWPGILQWGVEGCIEWQRIGLSPPAAVLDATAAYLDAQDAIGAWLDEYCNLDPNAWTARTQLYASWQAWAEKAREFVLPRPRFFDAMDAKGFAPITRNGVRSYRGISLKQVDYSDAHWNR